MTDESPPERTDERPMSLFEAFLWALGSMVALISALQGVRKIFPGTENDPATQSLCQTVVYLALIMLLQFIYFDKSSAKVVFGTTLGKWFFYPIALLLGVAIHFPTNAIYEAALARWPDVAPTDEMFKHFAPLPFWHKLAAGVGLVLLTPVIEEAFFRGALFGTLKRRYGTVAVVIGTSTLFAFVHVQPQIYIPIAIVGATLAFLRVASDSMWPGVVLHSTFNGISFWAVWSGAAAEGKDPTENIPVWLTLVGTAVTAALLVLVDYLRGKRDKAKDATEEQLS